MTTIAETCQSHGSQPAWQKQWSSHRGERKRKESSRKAETTPETPSEVWDKLSEIGEAREKKKDEEVIAYLEDRLSKLTTVEPSQEERGTTQDQYSSHHRDIIKKGAGGYE